MNPLEDFQCACPYCGEIIELRVDCSQIDQTSVDLGGVDLEYIEDCSVCCRPIRVFVSLNAHGQLQIELLHENE